MRRHSTAEKRAQLVELVTSTGATIAAAAAELGVQKSTASYWVPQGEETGSQSSPLVGGGDCEHGERG